MYQKKVPDQIEAIQYTDNVDEILAFVGDYTHYVQSPHYLVIQKPDGNVILQPGDYICRKVTSNTHNRSYACPGKIWEELMEPTGVLA